MLAKRNALSPLEVHSKSMRIQEYLTRSLIFQRSKVLGVYLSHGSEVMTQKIIEIGFNTNKIVGVPKMVDSKTIKFYRIHDTTADSLDEGRYGIQEPRETSTEISEAIDLLIVPGIAFDIHGNRLGHGTGYYDRFLSRNNKSVTIGLAFDKQVLKAQILPHDVYDKKIDNIVTESGMYSLSID